MGRFWHLPLAYPIAPKSGPIRQIATLKDANQALTHDLPFRSLKRPHWLAAGKALLAAADSGAPSDVQLVYDAFVAALEAEGWMSFARPSGPVRSAPPLPSAQPSAPTARQLSVTLARRLDNVVSIAERRAQRSPRLRAAAAEHPSDDSGSRTAE